MIVFRFFICLTLTSNLLFAQDISDILEQDVYLPKETPLQTSIDALLKNPTNLNTADYDDLSKIPYLTPIIINRILKARQNKTKFNSISELLQISGIDAELLEQISPLITLKQPAKSAFQMQIRSKLDTLANLNRFKDYDITARTNFMITSPDLKLRALIITDKDKKEKSVIDFLSSSVSITISNNRLVLGNYLLGFGSHLVFASPYSYSSTIKNFAFTPFKSINELSGAYENKSLFGIAYVHNLNQFNWTAFISSRRLDAEIKNNAVKRVFYYTRYADSLSLARQDRLQENLTGTRLTYLLNAKTLIGTTISHTNYDKPFAPTDSLNSFYGQSLLLAGIDIQTHLNNYFLNSELAYSISHGFGFATQIVGDWKFLRVNFALYAQTKNFFSSHSRWKTLTNRKDNLSTSFNIFYNLSGFKMYFLASTKQDFTQESLPARIQYRIERKQNKFNFGLVLKSTYKETQLKTYGSRFDLSYHFSKTLALATRLEDRYLVNKSGSGRLMAVSAKYHVNRLHCESRIYYFSISSSDCKIYAYEPIKNSYPFNQQGLRFFSYLETKIIRNLKISYYLGYTKTTLGNFDSGLQIVLNL